MSMAAEGAIGDWALSPIFCEATSLASGDSPPKRGLDAPTRPKAGLARTLVIGRPGDGAPFPVRSGERSLADRGLGEPNPAEDASVLSLLKRLFPPFSFRPKSLLAKEKLLPRSGESE